jgi:SAM-dependent methyltransferase
VADVIYALPLPDEPEILDAGCGTGGNLATWAERGRVSAFEIDDTSRAHAADRGVAVRVLPGHFPDGVPFDDASFDLVVTTDVIEHVEDDLGSLQALHRVTRPGGFLVMTVPALPALWSAHDEVHGHQRRYRRAQLVDLVTRAGWSVERCSYWNGLLLGAAAATRLAERVLRREPGPLSVPPGPVNRALGATLSAERRLIAHRDLPLGVSLVLSARRSAS